MSIRALESRLQALLDTPEGRRDFRRTRFAMRTIGALCKRIVEDSDQKQANLMKLAQQMEISSRTLRRRLEDESKLTLAELSDLAAAVGLQPVVSFERLSQPDED